MGFIIGGGLGCISGIAALIALIKKLKEKRALKKGFDNDMLTTELNALNEQIVELMERMEKLNKQEKEIRLANNEIMKELIMMMKDNNPDIIII